MLSNIPSHQIQSLTIKGLLDQEKKWTLKKMRESHKIHPSSILSTQMVTYTIEHYALWWVWTNKWINKDNQVNSGSRQKTQKNASWQLSTTQMITLNHCMAMLSPSKRESWNKQPSHQSDWHNKKNVQVVSLPDSVVVYTGQRLRINLPQV